MKLKTVVLISTACFIGVVGLGSFFILNKSDKKQENENTTVVNQNTTAVNQTSTSQQTETQQTENSAKILSSIKSFNSNPKHSQDLKINDFKIDEYPFKVAESPNVKSFYVWANSENKEYKLGEINVPSITIEPMKKGTVTLYVNQTAIGNIILNFCNRSKETKTLQQLVDENLWTATFKSLSVGDKYYIKGGNVQKGCSYDDFINCLGEVSYIITYDQESNSVEDLIKNNANAHLVWDYGTYVITIECKEKTWSSELGSAYKIIGKAELEALLNNVDKISQPLRKIDKISN